MRRARRTALIDRILSGQDLVLIFTSASTEGRTPDPPAETAAAHDDRTAAPAAAERPRCGCRESARRWSVTCSSRRCATGARAGSLEGRPQLLGALAGCGHGGRVLRLRHAEREPRGRVRPARRAGRRAAHLHPAGGGCSASSSSLCSRSGATPDQHRRALARGTVIVGALGLDRGARPRRVGGAGTRPTASRRTEVVRDESGTVAAAIVRFAMSQQSPPPATSADDSPEGRSVARLRIHRLRGACVRRRSAGSRIGGSARRSWSRSASCVGAGFGLYMTFARFNKALPGDTPDDSSTPPSTHRQHLGRDFEQD